MTIDRFAFRVDAAHHIGNGHVMRCLTLAQAIRDERRGTCLFICKELDGNLINEIEAKGFQVTTIDADPSMSERRMNSEPGWSDWLRGAPEVDAHSTREILNAFRPHWLVVDHYALGATWEKIACPNHTRVLVIDDLANRRHACQILLDQNLGRAPEDYLTLVPQHTPLLIGPRFALLRSEFSSLRSHSLEKRQIPTLRKVLITMGGVDANNATSKILNALQTTSRNLQLEVTVVLGPNAIWKDAVQAMALKSSPPANVLINCKNMAELMADADLVIGAAGSTSWERCCLGVPTLTAILADNQSEAAMHLERSGATLSLELCETLPDQLTDLLNKIARDSQLLKIMSQRASAITDGLGTNRVIEALYSSNIDSGATHG